MLAAVVALAFFVEAVTGFGGTVVTLAVGSFFVPVGRLLPAFLPLNLALSLFVLARDGRAVDRGVLLRRVAPWMLLGLPLGMGLARVLDGAQGLFGLFVAGLALRDLLRPLAAPPPAPPALLGAGVAHGAWGTGGPLVVWVLGGLGLDKTAFRATLAALWLSLNLVLLAGFARDGALGRESAALSLVLAPGLVAGAVAGQLAHTRLDAGRFRRLVSVGLLVAGLVGASRSLF